MNRGLGFEETETAVNAKLTHAMARVIVIQAPTARATNKPAFDFTAAQKYGRVDVLLPNGNHVLTPDLMIKDIRWALREFNPLRDYIIPAGDFSVIFAVGLILGREVTSIRVLKWIHEAREYQPVTLTIRN